MDWDAYLSAIDFIYELDGRYPSNQSVGWVYVMRNDELKRPLLKIGMTRRPPHERAIELSNTSIPGQYDALYFVHVSDARQAEAIAHQAGRSKTWLRICTARGARSNKACPAPNG